MLYKTLFLILGTFSQVRTQSTTPLEDNTQSIDTTTALYYYAIPTYSLHYNISEETISELAFELLVQEQFLSILSTQDVLKLLQSRHLIVQPKLLDIDFAKIMKHDIQPTAFLHELIHHVPDKKYQNMKSIANNFNIDFFKYQEYFMEQDEENLYNLFSSGYYTQESIDKTLAVMDRSEQNIIEIITRIVLEHMEKLSIKAIATQYQDQLEDLLTKKNVTPSEIRSYSTFNKMLNSFKALLNSEILWTTAIAPTSLVTVVNASIYTEQYPSYVKPYLMNIENDTIQIVDSITSNSSFAIINVTNELESHLIMKYNAKRVKECYCILTDEVTGVSVYVPKNITLKKNFILTENVGCTLHYGSPIICQKQLYGILTMWDEERLVYLTFTDKKDDEVPSVMPPLVDDVYSGVATHKVWLIVYLLFAVHIIVSN